MPLISVLRRQVDLSEFEASLVYKASSRTARTIIQVIQRNPILKNSQKERDREKSNIAVVAHTFNPRTQEAEAA